MGEKLFGPKRPRLVHDVLTTSDRADGQYVIADDGSHAKASLKL